MVNIITLCGNIGLKKEIEKVRKELLESTDSIVINPTFDRMYSEADFTQNELEIIREISYKKIDVCDSVYVVNERGVPFDNGTKDIIRYAVLNKKEIEYHRPIKPDDLWEHLYDLYQDIIKSIDFDSMILEIKNDYNHNRLINGLTGIVVYDLKSYMIKHLKSNKLIILEEPISEDKKESYTLEYVKHIMARRIIEYLSGTEIIAIYNNRDKI